LLPSVRLRRGGVVRVKHHAALLLGEAGTFPAELREQNGLSAPGLEYLILTAARTGEVLAATWDELALDAAVWTMPAARTKPGWEHRIPLSAPALAILRRLHNARQGPDVFLGGKAGSPLSNMAMLVLLRRMGRRDVTTHGFRSTFRMWAAERTNFSREVAEQALAHSLPDIGRGRLSAQCRVRETPAADKYLARFCLRPSKSG
jgi:integrase